MELSSTNWIILGAVVLVAIILIVRKQLNKRKAAQFKADESLIQHFVDDLGYDDKVEYKDLPNRDARLNWLEHHYPEFMAAAKRHYTDENITGAVAIHVDLKLLKNAFDYSTRERVISTYQYSSYKVSLAQYQEHIDTENAESKRIAELEAADRIRRAKEARESQAQKLAEEKKQKEAAKEYWNSLTDEQKSAFKKAKGKTARQEVLPAPAVTTPYPVDVIYAAIMATEFNKISSTNSNSIDYCESHPVNSGGGNDGGGGGGNDGGGGYDNSVSSSDSGSSGGGGGE